MVLEDFVVEEGKLKISTTSLSELECLVHLNDALKLILMLLIGIESKDSRSSGVL